MTFRPRELFMSLVILHASRHLYPLQRRLPAKVCIVARRTGHAAAS